MSDWVILALCIILPAIEGILDGYHRKELAKLMLSMQKYKD